VATTATHFTDIGGVHCTQPNAGPRFEGSEGSSMCRFILIPTLSLFFCSRAATVARFYQICNKKFCLAVSVSPARFLEQVIKVIGHAEEY